MPTPTTAAPPVEPQADPEPAPKPLHPRRHNLAHVLYLFGETAETVGLAGVYVAVGLLLAALFPWLATQRSALGLALIAGSVGLGGAFGVPLLRRWLHRRGCHENC